MLPSDLRAPVILFLLAVLLILFVLLRPDYLASPEVLGTLIVGQIVLAAVCRYRQSFFLILMLSFLWAGISLPLSGAWLQGRWLVLAVGALTGVAIYMKDRNHYFCAIHLIALFCVLSAVVSASVSGYPQEALLKSLSLFLVFLYGAMGARLAVPVLQPENFFRKLLVACEVTTYVSAIAYFLLRVALFGNPNSLGATMGVVVVPVLFWGFLCSETVVTRRRLGIELCLAMLLLVGSFSRAGIAAGLISCLLVCAAAKQYRVMVAGIAASIVIAILAALFVPRATENLGSASSQSVTSLLIYKGKPEQGLLGSRRGPWRQTLAVIKDHPWFGSGFGTSVTGQSATDFEFTRQRFIDSRMVREHGNSYLAILEWSGLLGVFPFYFLIGNVLLHAKKALVRLRSGGNIFSPAVPAASIIVAGLIGAAFEDWLFAVGYYVSVFFWAMTFILADLTNSRVVTHTEAITILTPNTPFATPAPVQ